jgi:hypothetical protein
MPGSLYDVIMVVNKLRLVRIARIALLAILVAALAPTLSSLFSQQLQRGSGTAWIEICRAGGGTAWVALADRKGEKAPSDAPAHGLQHCPYCALHADALPHAPALLQPTVAATPGFLMPAAFLHAPHTAHAWQPAQSRAPPARV